MKEKNSKPIRASKDFEEWTRKIIQERFARRKDKRPLTVPRLTKAITKVPRLKEVLENARIDI
jgi:hypothetical protein